MNRVMYIEIPAEEPGIGGSAYSGGEPFYGMMNVMQVENLDSAR